MGFQLTLTSGVAWAEPWILVLAGKAESLLPKFLGIWALATIFSGSFWALVSVLSGLTRCGGSKERELRALVLSMAG